MGDAPATDSCLVPDGWCDRPTLSPSTKKVWQPLLEEVFGTGVKFNALFDGQAKHSIARQQQPTVVQEKPMVSIAENNTPPVGRKFDAEKKQQVGGYRKSYQKPFEKNQKNFELNSFFK